MLGFYVHETGKLLNVEQREVLEERKKLTKVVERAKRYIGKTLIWVLVTAHDSWGICRL